MNAHMPATIARNGSRRAPTCEGTFVSTLAKSHGSARCQFVNISVRVLLPTVIVNRCGKRCSRKGSLSTHERTHAVQGFDGSLRPISVARRRQRAITVGPGVTSFGQRSQLGEHRFMHETRDIAVQ